MSMDREMILNAIFQRNAKLNHGVAYLYSIHRPPYLLFILYLSHAYLLKNSENNSKDSFSIV